MHVRILVLGGVFDLGLSALMDTLTTANELAHRVAPAVAPIQLEMVAVGRRVKTAQGFLVPTARLDSQTQPDALVVPALGAKMPEALQAALKGRDIQRAGEALAEAARQGVLVGAACTATFVLASQGLLDGHRATTTWWLSPLFRQLYPQVQLEEKKMLVSSAPYVTAGAALAHVDLALGLIRQRSPALAAMTARYLLVDERVSQAAFVIPDHLAHTDPLVERFERWARNRLAAGFCLPEAVNALGTSERTLLRRMQQTLGKSPLAYFQDLRVEQAVHLLQTSHQSLEQVAAAVGYQDAVSLRTLLKRKLGRGVKDLRPKPQD